MAPIRVLHVDDDEAFRDLTPRFLGGEGGEFEVLPESHPADALDRLGGGTEIDCVVSDHALPGMDGIEFVEAIREAHPDLPFILFTGKGSEEVARDALTGGATDYLQKGRGTEQYDLLANRIRNAVERYRDRRERERGERYRRELYRITSDTGRPFEAKIDRLLELGCERLGVENGHVTRIDPEAGRHEITWAAGSDFVRPDTVTALEETFCRETIAAPDIVAVYNAPAEGWEDDPAYDRWGIACYVGGRIEVGDELYGTVCFVDRKPRDREFTGPERAFVDLLSRWLSHMFERREAERELRTYQRILDAVSEGIFVLDADGEVTLVNDALSALTGYDPEELIGAPATRLFAEEVIDGDPPAGWTSAKLRTADGGTIQCEITVGATSGGDGGDATGQFGVVRERAEDGGRAGD